MTTRRSWAPGPSSCPTCRRGSATRSPRSSRSASRRCRSSMARLARGASPAAADVTISHPRFLEFVAPGVSKGRGRPLPGPSGARSRSGPCSRSATSGTTSRCSRRRARRGDADRPGPASRAVARYIAPPLEEEGAGADDRAAGARDTGRGRSAARDGSAAEAGPTAVRSGMTARVVADDAAGRAAAVEMLREGGRGRAADRHRLRHRRGARRRRAGSSACSRRSAARRTRGSCCCSPRRRRGRSGS